MSGGKLSLQRSLLTVWMCAEQEQRSGSCSGELWQLFMLPAPFIPVAFTNGLLWLGVEFSFPSDLENQHKFWASPLSSVLSLFYHMSVMNFISYLHGIVCLPPVLCSAFGFPLGMKTLRQQFCSSLFLFLQPTSSVYCLEKRTALTACSSVFKYQCGNSESVVWQKANLFVEMQTAS